jgi:hypothetical protein
MLRHANIEAMSREQLVEHCYRQRQRIIHLEGQLREMGELRRENRNLHQQKFLHWLSKGRRGFR